MEAYQERVWAEIDLDALAHNMREIRKKTGPKAEIMAVVKTDAYGHGAVEVAETLLENGADRLAVAMLDEAVELRRQGITAPMLILGLTHPEYYEAVIQADAAQTVDSFEQARALSEAAEKVGKKAVIHIKLDTGMGRIGYTCREKDIEEVKRITRLPNLFAEGIFTHFAKADEEDPAFTREQFWRFMGFLDRLEKEGIRFPVRHVSNSAATLRFPEMHLEMVRPGIILYGYYPSEAFDKDLLDLKPVMSLRAKITHIKDMEEGETVSYGGTYRVKGQQKIATVPVGYGDGYFRILSGKARMFVHGEPVPVVGRICMDQSMIDVSSVHTIRIGDEVVIFGNEGGKGISLDALAKEAGTIPYELLCAVSRRVPRVYLKGGKAIRVHNSLNPAAQGRECGKN